MNFNERKLPKEAAQKMRLCPIETVRPFALMFSPVYVYMKLNEKFVAVKAPLDFFSPDELERLKPFESFFLPDSVDAFLDIRDLARKARAMLSWSPDRDEALLAKIGGKEKFPAVLPPASYELSDGLLLMLAQAWVPKGGKLEADVFAITAFANEICDLLPGDVLRQARDLSVEKYERGVLLSSWVVFLAMHLGFCDLKFLSELRRYVFQEYVIEGSGLNWCVEIDELVILAQQHFEKLQDGKLPATLLESGADRAALKLLSRFKRLKTFMPAPAPVGAGAATATGGPARV